MLRHLIFSQNSFGEQENLSLLLRQTLKMQTQLKAKTLINYEEISINIIFPSRKIYFYSKIHLQIHNRFLTVLAKLYFVKGFRQLIKQTSIHKTNKNVK